MQPHVAHTNEILGVPSFIWLGSDQANPLKLAVGATPVDVSWGTLKAVKGTLKLSDAALGAAKITAIRDIGRGPIITRFGQTIDGVDVFGVEMNVTLKRDNTPVAVTGSLAPSTKILAAKGWALDARAAIKLAYKEMTGNEVSTGALAAAGNDSAGAERYAFSLATNVGTLFTRSRAKRVWYPQPEGLIPAWYVEVDAATSHNSDSQLKSFVIHAVKGDTLFSNDLTASDSYHYRVWADGTGPHGLAPLDSPYGNAVTPNPAGAPVANPVEPSFVFSSLVNLQNSPFSHNDPWLPANAMELDGNNARAYADLVDPDGYTPMSADVLVTPTSAGYFDRFYDPNTLPGASTNNIQAVTTNLFFVVNYMHDLFYDSGWTETMRNPQKDNYGRGGVAGDQIHAESQDYSGVDNANASTPADGASPRIQMYLWDYVVDQKLTVNTPPSVAGDYSDIVAAGWGPLSYTVTKDVARWVDGTGGLSTACNTGEAPMNSVMGKIALIDRGSCNFTVKATNAKTYGAVAILISNATNGAMQQGFGGSSTDPLIPGLSDFPGMMIAKVDGDRLIADAGNGLNVTFFKSPPHRDGSLDGTVMSHEWGHILSNRIIGNANGLSNNQGRGMGEGWSDFVALLTYVRPTDLNVPSNANWMGAYPMGTYAYYGNNFDVTYYGIRRYPYSNDMTKNPLMFRHTSGTIALPTNPAPVCGTNCGSNYEVHNTGEVWTSMLWDCYVGLLRDGSYTFDTASQGMRDYLVASLANTPNAPTFTEARDAWLLVAAANGTHPNDLMTFAQAFARRGLGTGAISAGRTSTTNVTVTESTVVGGDVGLVSVAVDDDVTSCDHDHVLDTNETGTVTVKVKNLGIVTLNGLTVKLTSTNPNITFPTATQAVPALAMFNTGTITFQVQMAAGLTAITPYDINVEMNDPSLVAGPKPIPRTGTANFVGNYDWAPNSSAADDASAPTSLWSNGSDPTLFQLPWTRIITPGTTTGVSWFGQNPPATADTYLVSPPLSVGAGNFSFTFKNAYDFEFLAGSPAVYFDGGVVELSADGGATWIDIGNKFTAGGYNATLYDGTDANLGPSDNPLKGKPAFGGTSTGFPAFLAAAAAVDLGTTYANQTVRIRFRIGADQGGSRNGWLVDDITFTGLTNTPFTTQVVDRGLCANHAPVANAGADQMVNEGTGVTLDGSGSSDADVGDVLAYHWTQVGGPVVALSSATAQKPTFTAPLVSADTVLIFQLVVDDSHVSSAPSTMHITVKDVIPPDMALPPDMTMPADMTAPRDMTAAPADLAKAPDDLTSADDLAEPPPPDMAKGGNHGGCSATGSSSNAPASALPLMGLALLGFALRRRTRNS